MVKSTPKKRVIKKQETVRERTGRGSTTHEAKPRRMRHKTTAVLKPLRKLAELASKLFQPLAKSPVGRVFGKVLRPLRPGFLINAWRELGQVVWPSRKETAKLTSAVLIFALSFGLFIAVIDFILDKVFKEVLLK